MPEPAMNDVDRSNPRFLARLARAVRLGWRYRRELMAALLLLPPVAILVRRNGFRRTTAWLASRSRPRPRELEVLDPIDTALDLAFVVRLASRLAPDATCLRQALVLEHLLSRRGIPSVVRLGARRIPGETEVAFHAWVEVDDTVVSEPETVLAAYTVLNADDPGRAPL